MEQTIDYKGYTIQIERDGDPSNPRKDWDIKSKAEKQSKRTKRLIRSKVPLIYRQ